LLCDRISKYYYKHLNRWKLFVQASKAAELEMTSFKRASQIRISVNSKSPNRLIQWPHKSGRTTSSTSGLKKQETWGDISFRNDHVSGESRVFAGLLKDFTQRKLRSSSEFELKKDPDTPKHMKYLTPLKDQSPMIKNLSHISKASDIKPTAADDIDNWSDLDPEATVSFLQDSLRGAGVSCLAGSLGSLVRKRLMGGFHCVYIRYTQSVAASASLSYLDAARLRQLKVGWGALQALTKENKIRQPLTRAESDLPKQVKTPQFSGEFEGLVGVFQRHIEEAWGLIKTYHKLLKRPGVILSTRGKARYAAYPAEEPMSELVGRRLTHLKNSLDIHSRVTNSSLRDTLCRWRKSKTYDMPRLYDPPRPKDTRKACVMAQALLKLNKTVQRRLEQQGFMKLSHRGSSVQLKAKGLQILIKNLLKDARFRQQVALQRWRVTVRQDETEVLRTIAMAQTLSQLRLNKQLSFFQCLQAATRKVKRVVDIGGVFGLAERLQSRRLGLAFDYWRSASSQHSSNVRGAVSILASLRLVVRRRLNPLFKYKAGPLVGDWISHLQATSNKHAVKACRRLLKARQVLKAYLRSTSYYLKYTKLQTLSSWRSVKPRPNKMQATYLSLVLSSVASKSSAQAWQRLKYFAVKQSFSLKSRQQAVRGFLTSSNNSLLKSKAFTLQQWGLRTKEERHLEDLEVVLRSWVQRRVQKSVIRNWSIDIIKTKRITRGLELLGKLYRWRLDDYFQTFSSVYGLQFTDSPFMTPPRRSLSTQSQTKSLRTLAYFAGRQANVQQRRAWQQWRALPRKTRVARTSNKPILVTISTLARLAEFFKIKQKEYLYFSYKRLTGKTRRLNARQTALMRRSISNWNMQISSNSRRVLECFRQWRRNVVSYAFSLNVKR
jgi:hypothetical protein